MSAIWHDGRANTVTDTHARPPVARCGWRSAAASTTTTTVVSPRPERLRVACPPGGREGAAGKSGLPARLT